MGMTLRESIDAVALGLIPGDQLPEIATTGLIEGYDCKSLAALAGESTAYYDPVECQRLWNAALLELGLEIPDQIGAARSLVRTYARLVTAGELTSRDGAAKIVVVHLAAYRSDRDLQFVGDSIGAARIIGLFYEHDDCGFLDEEAHEQIDADIRHECRALASGPAG
jgi:hypothetical protein